MYYKKSRDEFDKKLFENPTGEYRAAPFWAWNTSLKKEELDEQIDIFKEMGFGGFFMHVRQGLESEYLGDEFMSAVRSCTQKAKDNGMYACLYDEDRWPSGAAGGFVTQNKAYRQRYLSMTVNDTGNDLPTKDEALREGKAFFLAAFDIAVDENGFMTGYKRVGRYDDADNKRYFFANVRQGGEARYNLQSYSDNMNKESVDKFISVTYEAFKNAVGENFNREIPFIFTDEPQVAQMCMPQSGFSENEAVYAWTIDFDDTYEKEYGESIIEKLPELFFSVHGDGAAKTRYNYYRHVSERFNSAYMDNIGQWCEDNNINLTGHVLAEDSLFEAVRNNCDVMRTYKNMQMPGIDVLFNDRCFNTAIQCRSAVRQYGKEGMMSELYGVTGWDFGFYGYKFQGDWQAALGVTYRVPHLAWQTMKGEGKRDYPASIFYQSPWYKEYKSIEDHYARIASVLTRGSAANRTAVIHPIESYWTLRGSRAESECRYNELDNHFEELSKWLISACVDFDYIAESLLEDLSKEGGAPLKVGKMQYDTIIVSDCITLRPHTVRLLNKFKECGGNLIIMGRVPYMMLAVENDEVKELTKNAQIIPFSKPDLYKKILKNNEIIIKNSDKTLTENLICTLRNDGECKWAFIAHSDMPELRHISNRQEIIIEIKGCYKPALYDTFNGTVSDMEYINTGGVTRVFAQIYDMDSLLINFRPTEELKTAVKSDIKTKSYEEIRIGGEVDYVTEEENVLVLDMAEYSLNGGEWQSKEEILRIDKIVREKLGLSTRKAKFIVQPWFIKDEPENDMLKLRYRFYSEINCKNACLCLENAEKTHIIFNGEKVRSDICGYYVDKNINKIKLPEIKKGENILELTIPFGLRTDIENCFISGDFAVVCKGDFAYICEKPKKIRFGSIVNQGYAFYGGNIEYSSELNIEDDCELEFEISYFSGALVKVFVDNQDKGNIFIPPFRLRTDTIKKGTHRIRFVLYGTRYNTFSALHTLLADKKGVYIGPDYWRSEKDGWAYEYQTRPAGILKSPIVRIIKK